jgi:hypothetical protein
MASKGLSQSAPFHLKNPLGGACGFRLITPFWLPPSTRMGVGWFWAARAQAREPKFYYTTDPSNLSIGKPHK